MASTDPTPIRGAGTESRGFPVETVTGESVSIIEKVWRDGVQLLVADAGAEFVTLPSSGLVAPLSAVEAGRVAGESLEAAVRAYGHGRPR